MRSFWFSQAFPRAVGVAKEHLRSEVGDQFSVFADLDALVVGDALVQGLRNRQQFAREGLTHALSILGRQKAKEGVTGGALDQNPLPSGCLHP